MNRAFALQPRKDEQRILKMSIFVCAHYSFLAVSFFSCFFGGMTAQSFRRVSEDDVVIDEDFDVTGRSGLQLDTLQKSTTPKCAVSNRFCSFVLLLLSFMVRELIV